ncbi:MAG: CHAT domain-containing protein [Bacteroidia bacterium]|nr:CHAT domain-containing protein [Bacteroidia bacterium]
MEAGAQSVLVSLWPINDEATRELMERFYITYLKQRKRAPQKVFAAAQRAFRKIYPAPYYWELSY